MRVKIILCDILNNPLFQKHIYPFVHDTVLRCKNSSDHDEEVFEFTSKCDTEDCSGVDSNSFYEKKDWLGKIEKYNESFDAWTSMNFNY